MEQRGLARPAGRAPRGRTRRAARGLRVGRTRPLTITHGAYVHLADLQPDIGARDAIPGDPDGLVAGLAAHAALGCDHLIAWLLPSTVEAVDRLGDALGRVRRNADASSGA